VFSLITASSARASPNGMATKPPLKGPKCSRYWRSEEKPTMVDVRPWKLPVQHTISAAPSGTPFTV